jgi:hypothetical protein
LLLAPSTATLFLSEAEEVALGRGGLQAVRELRAAGQVGVRLQIIIEGNTGSVEAARRKVREGLRSHVQEDGWKQQEESIVDKKQEDGELQKPSEKPRDVKKKASSNPGEEVSESVTVSKEDALAIIGIRGLVVKELRRKTGARIHVIGSKDDVKQKVVITGTEEAVELAKVEVDKVVNKPPTMMVTKDEACFLTRGAGGKVRETLKNKFGTTINIKGKQTDEKRSVVINGSDSSNIKNTEESLKKIVKNITSVTEELKDCEVEKLMAGRGERLHTIEKESGAVMSLTGIRGDPLRNIVITGKGESAKKARSIMLQVLVS